MAWIVADGWDYYGQAGDTARSVWDTSSAGFIGMHPGRFGTGQSVTYFAGGYLTKAIPTHESTVFFTFAFYHSGALPGGTTNLICAQFNEGGAGQVTMAILSDGSAVLRRGDVNGAIVAQWPGALQQDLWTHFQMRAVIDPAAGSFTVRKNGAPADSFSATGLNTRNTANSWTDTVGLQGNDSNSYLDDVLIFSGSGAAPNTWVGDVRAITLPVALETAQKQFIPTPSTQTSTFGPGNGSNGLTVAANTLYFSGKFSPAKSGPLVSLTAYFNASLTGHALIGLYDASGPSGQPGVLLAAAPVITNPTPTQLVTFSSPVPVAAGQNYYVALLPDTGWSMNGYGGAFNIYSTPQAYTSGLPATAPTVLTGLPDNFARPGVTLTVTGGNIMCVSDTLANGDTDYVSSTNLNDEDLYGVAPMPVTPLAIIGVVSHCYIRKSDAGTRQGQIRVKSGATEVAGADTAVSSTWQYLARVDAQDPATGTAWTKAGVNALQIGQKVTL